MQPPHFYYLDVLKKLSLFFRNRENLLKSNLSKWVSCPNPFQANHAKLQYTNHKHLSYFLITINM